MVDYEALIGNLAGGSETLGLLTMQATETTGRLMTGFPGRLKTLFSAEHGFFGAAAPGERTDSTWHPRWNRPIHSLYGEHRRPTPEMLSGIGRMVIDLCDIGVRCYTYLATLKNTIEACAECNVPVTVLDRPIPMGGIVDGPSVADGFGSFVAPMDIPLCHGMTPGECAVFIRDHFAPRADLTVIELSGWSHDGRWPWPNFVPPSPAIRGWDNAVAYPMTVFTEAYPAIDCDRGGTLSFRVLGAPWMDVGRMIGELGDELDGFGVSMRPYFYTPNGGPYSGTLLEGVLLSVADPARYHPVKAGAVLLSALLRRYGERMSGNGARPEWLDRLAGSPALRLSAMSGHLGSLFESWDRDNGEYLERRVNLYR